jgi:NAD(P)-dependent dehydrogenase (short-subunit alcohol dehydrogenase family)
MDRLGAKLSDQEKKALGLFIESDIPLQRMGLIGDIANATVFLFSEAASWITGQALVSGAHLSSTRLSSRPLGGRRRLPPYRRTLSSLSFWDS